jgi:hypothetical protein
VGGGWFVNHIGRRLPVSSVRRGPANAATFLNEFSISLVYFWLP